MNKGMTETRTAEHEPRIAEIHARMEAGLILPDSVSRYLPRVILGLDLPPPAAGQIRAV